MQTAIGVKEINQQDPRTLRILWTDDKENLYDVVELRKRCPCAMCIDELTRKPLLDPNSVADSVRPVRLDSVGRYALNIRFNDGHGTGIFTFDLLRSM